jgi:hypothetical protein
VSPDTVLYVSAYRTDRGQRGVFFALCEDTVHERVSEWILAGDRDSSPVQAVRAGDLPIPAGLALCAQATAAALAVSQSRWMPVAGQQRATVIL